MAPIFYFAVACFGYWFVADLRQWPLSAHALLIGLACFAAVAIGRFLHNRKAGSYQVFYLAGRISLLVGVAIYLNAWPYATGFFWTAFSCFGVGLFLLSRKNK
jgi:hypothetical protein